MDDLLTQPSTDAAPYTGVARLPPCDTCTFWAYPCATTRSVPGRWGECRKRAPKLLIDPARGTASRHWPITGSMDGCGEHLPRPLPPTT